MWYKNFALSFLLVILGFTQATTKSFEIPKIRVETTINADGTVQITEHLTYTFDGEFSWGEYTLPKKGFTAISNIQISENGKSYINKNTESPGTFSVAESDDAIKLTWHYNAEDEQRTFTISYTLEGALTVGPAWSQFFWNYLSEDRDKSTEQLDITIYLPEAVSADSLYGWTRTPLGRMDLQKDRNKLIINGSNIDNSEFAKVRTLFPTSLLTGPEITNPNFSLRQVQEQEQAYEEKTAELKEWKQQWQETGTNIHIAILLLAIIIFYFLYRKYGKRHSTSHLSSTETIMIPDREPPAAIGWLLSGRHVQSVHLISTVLDLARRGYFKIQEEEPEEGMFKDEDPTFSVKRTDQDLRDDLLDWEKEVIQFIEKRLDEDHQKLHKIFEGKDSEVSSWFSEWKKRLKDYCFDKEWVDLKSYTGAYWNLGIQLFLLFITIGLLIYAVHDYAFDFAPSYWFSWFGALLVTAMATIFSLAIIRPTQKGEETKHEWNKYKEGLQNAEEHNISSDKLDKHFIYGLALGLGEDELEQIFTAHADTAPVYSWIIFMSHTSSPAAIASSFSTLGATGAATAPGTSGGAGASAGAAGGGAAASAG